MPTARKAATVKVDCSPQRPKAFRIVAKGDRVRSSLGA